MASAMNNIDVRLILRQLLGVHGSSNHGGSKMASGSNSLPASQSAAAQSGPAKRAYIDCPSK
eukprot:4988582-Amphidinium_carterae.1